MLEFDPIEHRYTWEGRAVPSVTWILRSALGNPFERVAAELLEFARQRGIAVHRACELDDAGRLDEASVDPRILPYVEAWRVFRQQFLFEVLFAERPLYHRANRYAGTPDCVVRFPDGRRGVVDRKTGFPGPLAALQTAGYVNLCHAEFGMDADQMRRFALRMLPTGRYRLEEYTAPGDLRDFLACLAVYRLKERFADE